jgi:hypothetical protein
VLSIIAEQGPQPIAYLGCCVSIVTQNQDSTGVLSLDPNEIRDPVNEHACLARPWTGKDQNACPLPVV